MSQASATTLTVVLIVALGALIAYQIYMLRWTKKASGSVPKAVGFLRAANIVMLVIAAGLIAWALVRG